MMSDDDCHVHLILNLSSQFFCPSPRSSMTEHDYVVTTTTTTKKALVLLLVVVLVVQSSSTSTSILVFPH